LGDFELEKCVGCGAGLISVSDICPQCGFLKSKSIDLDEAEKKAANEIKSPSTKKPAKTKNKIFRPAGVRLISIFYMLIGLSMIVFAIIFGLAVMLLLMSSGMSTLVGLGDIGDMPMLPGMEPIDPETMSTLAIFIELNEITGSPSVSELEEKVESVGLMDFDGIMEIIGETSVNVIIEIGLGIFVVLVGRGLFKGNKWARPVTILSSIITIPLVVLFLENLDNLIILGIAAFDGMILYYMFKSKVRAYFNQTSTKKRKIVSEKRLSRLEEEVFGDEDKN